VVTLSFIPSILEATIHALIAYALFGMPMSLCFAMAFAVSCISPSVMIPGLINLLHRGFGVEKGICSSLIAAGTFDDIICIILFSICKAVALSEHGMTSAKNKSLAIGQVFLENLIGLAVGIFMGLVGKVFNYIPNSKVQ
jgi:solute carrier family 9B (sodium/hydrogen exchanger), member 1/2